MYEEAVVNLICGDRCGVPVPGNSPRRRCGDRGAQVVLAKIYKDPALLARVQEERAQIRDMLLARGRAFEDAAAEAGLEMVPFDAGFFASVPCENPDGVAARLEEEGIFTIPLNMGIRVSIASLQEDVCRRLPARIKAAIDAGK